jgi:hypothetical protein
MLCSLTFQLWEFHTSAHALRLKSRLTVGGLFHLKAVERGPMPFASGTHLARRSLFSSWAGTLENHRRLWFPDHFNLVVGSDYKFYACNVVTRNATSVGVVFA